MSATAPRRIFVLGDSRTGTTTIHKFLQVAGFRSIHYFFKESGVISPAHTDMEGNWRKLRVFIESGEYEAFSDYPTRSFYRQLFDTYPDAYYILTTRSDIGTWQRSMQGFFSKFDIEIDLESLTKSHNEINDDIINISEKRDLRLCTICIDDDAAENGRILSRFLGLDEVISLGWENSTSAYDNALWSKRVTLFNTTSEDVLSYVKRATQPSKAMLSEYGWVYLINDTSDFLDYYFGHKAWSEAEEERAIHVLKEREDLLSQGGVKYLKFSVPEKPVVYPEYLPKIFNGRLPAEERPSVRLMDSLGNFFSYPAELLRDARSYGQIYFRGDSHANWLGAFFLYQHIIDKLNEALKNTNCSRRPPFALSDFSVSLASYAGDLFVQLDKEMHAIFDGAWKSLRISQGVIDKIEYTLRYTLSEAKREATKLAVESDYLDLLGDRETFRYSHPNKELPRAVIFRDSTADYLIEPLSEHFCDSLFIWHKGLVYSDVIEREKPDVVIHLMAERFIVQYPAFSAFARLGI